MGLSLMGYGSMEQFLFDSTGFILKTQQHNTKKKKSETATFVIVSLSVIRSASAFYIDYVKLFLLSELISFICSAADVCDVANSG